MGHDRTARALARGQPDAADLTDADRAMIDYALTLTRRPHAITRNRVDGLRAHGFDDVAIHDICHVTAYYNYVNRMADGLGVELEEGWTADDLVLTREEFAERSSAEP